MSFSKRLSTTAGMALFYALFGCVSADKSGKFESATGDTNGLVLSVEERKVFSTDNLVMLDFTLRNETEEFLRFDSIQIEVPGELQDQVKLVVGQDLVNWSEGIKNKVAIDRHNNQMMMAGLMALGATAAVASQDASVQKLGLAAFTLGAGAITLNDIQIYRDRLRGTKFADLRGLIPETHILYAPVSVPPGLFLNRFAVFQMKKDQREIFHSLVLKIKKEGEEPVEFSAVFDSWRKMRATDGSLLAKRCLNSGDEIEFIRFKGRKLRCWSECSTYYRGYDLKDCRKKMEEKLK